MRDPKKTVEKIDELRALRRRQDELFDELERALVHEALKGDQRLWALERQIEGERDPMMLRHLRRELRLERRRHESRCHQVV